MQRYLQLAISEPLEPALMPDEGVQIETAVIGVDLHTGHITLPGGFVCSLASLIRVIYQMGVAREQWMQSGRGPWRTGRT